ncbi:hypothetical protein, partial [Actinophytocola sp.]|uniref:hypothetical protein n=1 Tax=Actinophytocola sp. TaxID=1872138 RepID=UPI003D6C0C7A
MNDHRSHRRGPGSPAWPTGDDPDSPANHAQPQERTGFWSPLWDDDDQPKADGPRVGGRSNGSNGHGSNGRAAHRLPDQETPGARHAAPPPRRARPSAGPAWPTE